MVNIINTATQRIF